MILLLSINSAARVAALLQPLKIFTAPRLCNITGIRWSTLESSCELWSDFFLLKNRDFPDCEKAKEY